MSEIPGDLESFDLIKDILSDTWNCLSIAALHIFLPIWTIFELFAKQEPDVLHEVGRGFCCAGRYQPLPACWGTVPWGGRRDKPVRLLLLVTLVQGCSAFYPLNCCLPVEEPYLGSRSDTPVRGAEKGEQQLSAFLSYHRPIIDWPCHSSFWILLKLLVLSKLIHWFL